MKPFFIKIESSKERDSGWQEEEVVSEYYIESGKALIITFEIFSNARKPQSGYKKEIKRQYCPIDQLPSEIRAKIPAE